MKVSWFTVLLIVVFSQASFSADFNFVFTFGCGHSDTLDTVHKAYIRQGTKTKFKLKKEEKNKIRKKIEEIDLWHYPEDLVVPADYLGRKIDIIPSSEDHIKVIDGKKVKEVRWIGPRPGLSDYYEPAVKLQELIDLIFKTLDSNPASKKIPKYTGPFCL